MRFVLALMAGAALAQEPAPTPPPPDPPMQTYGERDPACLAWTDSCQLCLRTPDNRTACSTPGIACTPGPLICTRKREP